MKLFECQHCGQPLYFENAHCEGCSRRLGYLPSKEIMAALEAGYADKAAALMLHHLTQSASQSQENVAA